MGKRGPCPAESTLVALVVFDLAMSGLRIESLAVEAKNITGIVLHLPKPNSNDSLTFERRSDPGDACESVCACTNGKDAVIPRLAFHCRSAGKHSCSGENTSEAEAINPFVNCTVDTDWRETFRCTPKDVNTASSDHKKMGHGNREFALSGPTGLAKATLTKKGIPHHEQTPRPDIPPARRSRRPRIGFL